MELAQTLLTCAYMHINLIMWTPTTVLMFETVSIVNIKCKNNAAAVVGTLAESHTCTLQD